jgi:hypothetical protein
MASINAGRNKKLTTLKLLKKFLMKNIYKPGTENRATYGYPNLPLKIGKPASKRIMAISVGKRKLGSL